MQFYEAIVVIICLTALFAYITERFTKWPTVIGITLFSLLLVVTSKLVPPHGSRSKNACGSYLFSSAPYPGFARTFAG